MHERPVIVIVDDETSVVAQLLDAITRRFGADYRVVPHLSARSALEDIARMKSEGEELALVIADQWMPEMTGTELLGRAHELDRTAKRALLVEWGDRSSAPAILEGCAFGQLDNYLLKPWSPAEVYLYPDVSEFLAEWTAAYRPRMEIVRVIGEEQTASLALDSASYSSAAGSLTAGTTRPPNGDAISSNARGSTVAAARDPIAGRSRAGRPIERRDLGRARCVDGRGG